MMAFFQALPNNASEVNILSSIGQENNAAEPKTGKCRCSTSHFSPFNCYLSVVISKINK